MSSIEANSIKKILISRYKFIGDIVLTTPIIKSLRDKFPNAYIAFLGEQKGTSLLDCNPNIDEIIKFDDSKNNLIQTILLLKKIRKIKFDIFIDLFSNPRTSLWAKWSGAKYKIGLNRGIRSKIFTHKIEITNTFESAITQYFKFLKPIGIEQNNYETEIFLSQKEVDEAKRFLLWQGLEMDKPIVAIHPGATWKNKCWLPENFSALIDLISAKTNAEIIISPGANDDELINFIVNNSYGKVKILPLLPVRQLAAILKCCKVLVSNDCGPMHIAVAVNTPTIGIFGPEPPEIWFPYSEKNGHKSFFTQLDCSPCRTTKCKLTNDDYLLCMQKISTEDIFETVKQRLTLN
ncbi:MAG: glycosyltransferase family 9 protein [Bacteroidetes bacterium]|nr:glycosyltransferase family 9 protein [Bacteroidota bacterium]